MEWKHSTAPVAYPEAMEFMEQRVASIIDGDAQECAWLLEHPPLYTGGTSAKATDMLQERFPVYDTGRGGEYTYHGPGQRIGYLMLDLKARAEHQGTQPDLRAYVKQLEQWIMDTLACFDVHGEVREGRIGVWVRTGTTEKKIAALGIRVRKWVSFHGIAINVNPDLSHYSGIVPCGISEFGVTSLADLGLDVNMQQLDEALKKTCPF